ncbi:MAG: caspase family protein, partial [Mesorhizobium sp.]|nr:caspase family protein [Mesorhizobium sp.]
MARWNDVLARWAVLAIVTLLSTAAVAQEKALKGVALVIGQSQYTSLAALPNPANDARSIAALLENLGFDVDTLMDADAAGLSGTVAKFETDAAGADVALVYYSGHGVEAGGENFLIPIDAAASEPKGFASATRLLERLQKTVPVAIILLDACRDNPFPPDAALVDENGRPQPIAAAGLGATRGVTRFASDPGKADSVGAIIGFAAEPGKVALDGEPGGRSPYAAALLKHLAAGGFHFADIMTMVTEEV